jgi:hypothetical protein
MAETNSVREPSLGPKSLSTQSKYDEVLLNISNLSNHILSNASSKKLTKWDILLRLAIVTTCSQLFRLRVTKPALFTEARLYTRVFGMLETYHFRLPARKFIQEVLFDNFVLDDKTWDEIDLLSVSL